MMDWLLFLFALIGGVAGWSVGRMVGRETEDELRDEICRLEHLLNIRPDLRRKL